MNSYHGRITLQPHARPRLRDAHAVRTRRREISRQGDPRSYRFLRDAYNIYSLAKSRHRSPISRSALGQIHQVRCCHSNARSLSSCMKARLWSWSPVILTEKDVAHRGKRLELGRRWRAPIDAREQDVNDGLRGEIRSEIANIRATKGLEAVEPNVVADQSEQEELSPNRLHPQHRTRPTAVCSHTQKYSSRKAAASSEMPPILLVA